MYLTKCNGMYSLYLSLMLYVNLAKQYIVVRPNKKILVLPANW